MSQDFALTFDDGPGPSTSELLDILDEFSVRGTFFLIGANLDAPRWCPAGASVAQDVVNRMIYADHIVGNHTMSHAWAPGIAELLDEIKRCDALIESAYRSAGRTISGQIPFRLPYGVRLVSDVIPVSVGRVTATFVDPRLMTIAMAGRTHVHWTSLFNDWNKAADDAPALADDIVRHVEECLAVGGRAVVALHDGGPGDEHGFDRTATVRAVRRFLETAARRGWQSFTVPA